VYKTHTEREREERERKRECWEAESYIPHLADPNSYTEHADKQPWMEPELLHVGEAEAAV
jgi:hypothetical protein